MRDISAWDRLSQDRDTGTDQEKTREVIGKTVKGLQAAEYGVRRFETQTARCIRRSDLTPEQKEAAINLCKVLSSMPDDDCLKCACFILDAIISDSCKSTAVTETVTIHNVYESQNKGYLYRNVSEEAYNVLSSNDGFLRLVHQYSNGRISTAPRKDQASEFYPYKVVSEYCTRYAVRSSEQNAVSVKHILLTCPPTFMMS